MGRGGYWNWAFDGWVEVCWIKVTRMEKKRGGYKDVGEDMGWGLRSD